MLGGIGIGAYTLLKYAVFIVLFLFFCLGITGVVIYALVKKSQIPITIFTQDKRQKSFTGRYKKKKGTEIKQFYIGKEKTTLPQFQQDDIYTKEGKDALVLYKDKNGLYHTLRVPKWEDVKKWYKVVHNIDLDNKNTIKDHQKLHDIYFQPSPHIDLDWLANKCVEAETEFKSLEWWKHPNVMIGMSVAGAVFIQMINLIILYMMHK